MRSPAEPASAPSEVRPGPQRPAWTLLRDQPRPGWENMALDQALLDAADATGAAWLRLYGWDPCCLSFGRHEPAARRYDRARIAALGLDCVRRPTGGRAVWHAQELTYAVAAPVAAFGSLADAYRAIHETLAGVIRALGLPARLAPPPDGALGLETGACFARPVGGEVLVDGWKVVGSAQLRQGDAFLQHGSILLAGNQDVVRQVTLGAAVPSGERALADLLRRPLTSGELAGHIAAAAADWPGRWREERLPHSLAAGAARHAGRFRGEAWTWRR